VPDKISANNELSGALARLLVVVENYPELKSSENFMRLQDELAGTENRIATERMRYNEVVQKYNIRNPPVPGRISWAGMFTFEKAVLFEAPAESKQAPKVQF